MLKTYSPRDDFPIFPLQILFVVLIIALLIFFATHSYQMAIAKANASKAFATLQMLKNEIVINQAFTGVWPETKDLEQDIAYQGEDLDVSGVEIKNGSFKLPVYLHKTKQQPMYLAFNRVELVSGKQSTAMWSCADHAPSAAFKLYNEFSSDLDKRFIFSICNK